MKDGAKALLAVFGFVIVGGVVYLLVKKGLDVNKGTPYEGAGAAGTLGNVTNQLLGGVPQSIGEAIGSGLYKIVNGDAAGGSDLYYTTTFPDGSKHAISSDDVDDDGSFRYLGVGYVMVTDRSGKHVAIRA